MGNETEEIVSYEAESSFTQRRKLLKLEKRKSPVVYEDISAAASRIENIVHKSPVLTSRHINRETGAQIYFKCENFQRSGNFKIRGAYNAILRIPEELRRMGVVTFSSGNHGQAIALAADLLKIHAVVVMPHDAPAVKVAAVRNYGAEVVLYHRETDDREAIAAEITARSGATLIPPYDHPDVVAGQGTVAKELFEEVGELDQLYICIGGGSLIAGSAVAAHQMSPSCQVIGVEPTAGNDAQLSLIQGRHVRIAVPHTIADGARTQQIGALELSIIRAHVPNIVTVNDDEIRAQMCFFAERMKIVAEPTGCVAAAGALRAANEIRGKRIGVVVTGGNVDLVTFCSCLRSENT